MFERQTDLIPIGRGGTPRHAHQLECPQGQPGVHHDRVTGKYQPLRRDGCLFVQNVVRGIPHLPPQLDHCFVAHVFASEDVWDSGIGSGIGI